MTKKIRSNNKWIDSSVFRKEAINFQKTGVYTAAIYGTPDWIDYWQTQLNRCINGFEIDGEKITGHHYFYLNFTQIQIAEVDENDATVAKKVTKNPDFWDGDYDYFWCLEIAEKGLFNTSSQVVTSEKEKKEYKELSFFLKELAKLDKKDTDEYVKTKVKRDGLCQKVLDRIGLIVKPHLDYLDGGNHMIVGKKRRAGYSYKNGAICSNIYNSIRKAKVVVGAFEKKYYEPIIAMAFDFLNFLNQNTGWAKARDYINRKDHAKASYKTTENGIEVEKGYKSEISALSFMDKPDAARGTDIKLVLFEEAGVFPNLKAAFNATKPALTAGIYITGQIVIFGCVCAGTKVYNNNGKLVNIEDITKETGIIGYAGMGVCVEPVTYIAPPNKKDCYRITCSNNYIIECSDDHPLLYSARHKYINKEKIVSFKRAKDLVVGEQLMQVRQVPMFGNKIINYPRLVGLLIGDGYYGLNSTPQLAVADKGIIDFLDNEKINYTIYKEFDNYLYIGITNYQNELKDIGIYGQTKLNKRLPKDYWEYSHKCLSELVGGYFDADGSISYNNKKDSYKITLTSICIELLEEVKDILFRFGISCTIHKRNDKDTGLIKSNINKKTYTNIKSNVRYSLEIHSIEDIIEFKKHIYFTDNKKQEILNTVDITRKGRNTYDKCIYAQELDKKGEIFKYTELRHLKSVYIKKVEYIGEKEVYNLTADTTHTYITNNFISHNTGGDMESGTVDYADMFYNPIQFGLMPFMNIWDKDAENTTCGFFHPVTWNMEGFYDAQGNSDIESATEFELERRDKILRNSSSSTVLQGHIQEYPFSPSEAFLTVSTNNFPILELRNQLNKVTTEKLQFKKGTSVTLERVEGKVTAKPDLKNILTPVINYNPKLTDLSGCPIIYEYPIDNAPKGLYKIGYDPYRQDLSQGVSLAAIYVYKGVYKGSFSKNIIVAEYVGRPPEADDVNRIASLLAELYNAEIMHENEVTHVKNYFRRIKRLDQLAAQPDAVISKNVKNSTVARVYGIHMNDKLKDAGEKYIKDWLLEVKDYDENGSPILNLDSIYSVGLLEELIAYNRKGNFDRVMSFMMCMFFVQEESLGKEYNQETESNAKHIFDMLDKMYNR